MSCIRPLGGYLSIPVDKVEYTGIDYINPEGKVISTVIIDQDRRTIAVDVKELSSIPVSLLDPQPLTTQDGDFVLACTVKNAVRAEYKWLSYSDLVSRISTNESNIDQLKTELSKEILRAKSIEEEINSRLTEEISRATKAEEVLSKRIDDLDYSSDVLTSSETISQITQADGKILVTKQNIQVEMSQVTDLNDEFSNVRDEFKEADSQLNDLLSQKIIDEQTRATGVETSIENNLNSHISNKENPHEVTKAQVGLDKVDNTSDEDKPVSTATQNALNDLNTSLTNYVDNLIKSMGTLKGTLEEGTLEIGPGDQVSN